MYTRKETLDWPIFHAHTHCVIQFGASVDFKNHLTQAFFYDYPANGG